MYPTHLPSSPSSVDVTPSSSPVFGPVDSSPPSSPGLAPYSLDSPPRPPFSHPFAASTKAIKLPHYEKKVETPLCTPPGTFTLRSVGLCRGIAASRSLQEDDLDTVRSASPDPSPSSTCLDEECIWEDAIRKPFDTGNGQIDLSYQGLTYMPPSIKDLAGFFNTPEVSEQSLFSARPLARVRTDPSRTRSFERTQSIQDSGKERHVLKLYLMGNSITSLPHELFTVKNLTVLSLRNNNLTYIPPEICLLEKLNELNISNNKLTFLPWQMRDMKIEKLLVYPNPFLSEPKPTSEYASGTDPDASPASHRRRFITRLWFPPTKPILTSVTGMFDVVPPLTELCLRRLLAPSSSAAQTVFIEYYGSPLNDAWSTRVPPSILCILCDSATVPRPRKRATVPAPAASPEPPETCPNPAHKGAVFVKYGSERYSWERHVAGVDVGGTVPLRWRGCLPGCLNFLEEVTPGLVALRPRVFSREASDSDVEIPALAVQAVDLGDGDLDMDDFDD